MSDNALNLLGKNMSKLSELVEKYPLYIPVLAVAEILHIKTRGSSCLCGTGAVPFGFCWKLGDRMAYKVPTLAFVAWITHGTVMPT